MKTIVMPGGVSAIFEPHISATPYISGARGAGVCIHDAVELTITISPSESLEITNIINDRRVTGGVGESAVVAFFETIGIEPQYSVEIRQKVRVPIGCGFGTSAASALGIVLLLAEEFHVPLTLVEAGDIAHIAEIRARSGLGTVSGIVFPGDIVIVSKPGPPSSCLVDRIIIDGDDIFVVLASKGRMETSRALSDPKLIERASSLGKLAMDKLINRPTTETFFRVARWFSESMSLMTPTISKVIDILDKNKKCIGAAQAMIGDSIFVLAYKEDVDDVCATIREHMDVPCQVRRLIRAGIRIPTRRVSEAG